MEKDVKEIGEEIAKILEENNCKIAVNLISGNWFTRFFRRLIKIDFSLKIQKNAVHKHTKN